MRWRCVPVVMAAGLLSGCFDFTADSVFRPDGTAQVTAEVGVSMQLATLLSGQPRQGPVDILADCEKDHPVDTLPAGVTSMKGKRGQRGDMALCTYVIEVSDPVAASAAQQRTQRGTPGLYGLDRSYLRVERLRDGVYRLTGEFKGIDDPLGRAGSGGDLAANAMVLAMTANRYVTVSVSAARIENATGEMQPDGRKVTWKVPLMSLLKTVPGTPYEIKADVVYAESLASKVRRWLGLD